MTVLWRYHLAHEFPQEIESLRTEFPDTQQVVAEDREQFRSALPHADIVVSAPMTEAEHRSAVSMKAHFMPYAGVNRLPLNEYAERGIIVANSHGNADVVAERAVTLALAAAGRVVEFHNGLREGLWARRHGDPAQIFEYWQSLQGKRCVSVGVGRIGCRIAELMRGFNCEFTGVGRRASRPEGGDLSATTGDNRSDQNSKDNQDNTRSRQGTQNAPFERIETNLITALHGADVVFLALPLTPETEGIIGSEALQAMDGALLVNVSRGEIIQEEPLYRSLSSRTAGHPDARPETEKGPYAAGLDCWWVYPDSFEEPRLPSRFPFHRLDNVVLSPHAASHTSEGKWGQLAETLENIRSFLKTGTPKHKVDLTAGY